MRKGGNKYGGTRCGRKQSCFSALRLTASEKHTRTMKIERKRRERRSVSKLVFGTPLSSTHYHTVLNVDHPIGHIIYKG